MKGSLSPKVKICCISSTAEAALAMKYGADALGLVGAMPSGPGIITDNQIKEIAAYIPPHVDSFLLTSETSASAIIAHHQKVNTKTIQLVDVLKDGSYAEIRAALPDIKLVQVVHVRSEADVATAVALSEQVDALLLDSGNPDLKVKELGGTGRTHDWKLSKLIREESKIPVFLAGGLNSTNVQAAIAAVQPYGVDLCSGVRTAKQLDEKKLAAFFDAVRGNVD